MPPRSEIAASDQITLKSTLLPKTQAGLELPGGSWCGGRNIGAPAPDRCHDAQLLGNLFKRGILWKPLKGVKDSLFVRHYQRVVPVLAAGKRALRTYNSFGDSLRFHFLPLRARVRLSVNENADSFAWLEKADGLPMRIQGSCSFGRAATNHVVLADERVSRRHAIIHTQREGEFWLLDLGSSNGTYINGRRLGKPSRLRNGDTIQIGAFQAVFRLGGRGEPDPTASRLAANQTLVATKSCPCWLLLADIEGSSGLSQRLDAETLAALIGHWLTRCKEAIEGEGGAINKYLGDGFFAYWPAAQVTPPRLVAALGALRQLQDPERAPVPPGFALRPGAHGRDGVHGRGKPPGKGCQFCLPDGEAGSHAWATPLAERGGGAATGSEPYDHACRPTPAYRLRRRASVLELLDSGFTWTGKTFQIRLDIFADGAVGREVADAGHVQDGLPGPVPPVQVSLADLLLAMDVAAVVGQEDEVVMVEQGVHQGPEQVRITLAKEAGGDLVQGFFEFRVRLVIIARAIAARAQVSHFGGREPEEEEVVGADLVPDFDVRAVQGADGKGAVHGEFHVAGAGGLEAGGRDLLGEVGGGIDPLRSLDVEVGQEHHFEPAGQGGILVDDAGDTVDQLDDEFGKIVARGGFAAKNERARRGLEVRLFAQPVIQGDDVENV